MLIIDKLLLSPIYATVWAARQIQNTIQQERKAEPAQITAELSELYMRLEAGQISEAELLARLEGTTPDATPPAAPAGALHQQELFSSL